MTRAALTVLTAAALGLGGCGLLGPAPEPDCDVGDQREHDRDCGYWDVTTGRFVFWGWVTLGSDSSPPPGWTPHVPRGGSHVAPPNARTDVPTVPAPSRPRASTPRGSTGGPAGGGVRVPAPPPPPRPPAPAPRPPAPPRPAGR